MFVPPKMSKALLDDLLDRTCRIPPMLSQCFEIENTTGCTLLLTDCTVMYGGILNLQLLIDSYVYVTVDVYYKCIMLLKSVSYVPLVGLSLG